MKLTLKMFSKVKLQSTILLYIHICVPIYIELYIHITCIPMNILSHILYNKLYTVICIVSMNIY